MKPFKRSWIPRNIFMRALFTVLVLLATVIILVPSRVDAQVESIARDLANPLSSLWNIVNQINFNQLKGGAFLEKHSQFNWNFQPVLPIPINDQFSLITRPVVPYYSTPYVDLTGAIDHALGLGDIQLATLVAPNKDEGIIYGIGATVIAPTAGDSIHIGQGLWQAGPTDGLFYVTKNFVGGVFPQHWNAVSDVDKLDPGRRWKHLQ